MCVCVGGVVRLFHGGLVEIQRMRVQKAYTMLEKRYSFSFFILIKLCVCIHWYKRSKSMSYVSQLV